MATTTKTTKSTKTTATKRPVTGAAAKRGTKTPPAAAAAARRGATAKKEAEAPSATVVEDKPVVAGPVLKKPDFIDSVVTRTGMKKKDVKPVIEAAMALLGDAIEEGREVNFPELGKVKVNREKELSGAKVIVCKLRRVKKAGGAGPDPLAKAAE